MVEKRPWAGAVFMYVRRQSKSLAKQIFCLLQLVVKFKFALSLSPKAETTWTRSQAGKKNEWTVAD